MKNITEKVKTFEDALAITGRPSTPDFSNVPEDMKEYFEGQYQMIVITEALNEGWIPYWANNKQRKWVPWFWVSSSGFVFGDTFCYYSYAGYGSRLCFKNEALARYAGQQFIDIWSKILLKK